MKKAHILVNCCEISKLNEQSKILKELSKTEKSNTTSKSDLKIRPARDCETVVLGASDDGIMPLQF